MDSKFNVGELVLNPNGTKARVVRKKYSGLDGYHYHLNNWLGSVPEERIRKLNDFNKHKQKLNL